MSNTLDHKTCNMVINSRVLMLNVASVAALLGWDHGRIKRDVESGKFLWTFNFSFRGHAGEPRLDGLRWWIGELADPAAMKSLTVGQVIQEILGTTRFRFEPGDVCRRFSISKVQLGDIRKELKAPLGTMTRPALAEFLEKRWTGQLQKRGNN